MVSGGHNWATAVVMISALLRSLAGTDVMLKLDDGGEILKGTSYKDC